MNRFEQLLMAHPGRWPITDQKGNSLRLTPDGRGVIDDRFGGEVNRYASAPTEAELANELDCQETS